MPAMLPQETPAEEAPGAAARGDLLELSPVEQVFTGAGACPITFVFEFAAALDPGALAASLAQALRAFPLLQGRLLDGGARGVAILPDASVGQLQLCSEAEGEAAVAAALAPLGVSTGGEAARFTLVQGATSCRLTASMSHAVVDGYAFVTFLCSWARIARGLTGLPMTRQPIAAQVSTAPVTPERVLADSGAFWQPGYERSVATGLTLCRRRFRLEQLASLRASIREAYGVNLSDNDLIAAQLWREFGPFTERPDTPLYLTCPVDARPLCRALGRSHMGCAITFATAALPASEVQDAPLAQLALAIRRAVGAVDEARVQASMSTLASLRAQQGAGALEQIHLTHPTRGLLVTNLSRLPLQELDFGRGPPRSFEAGVQLQRCAVLCACPGGVEARVYLPARGAAAPLTPATTRGVSP